MIWPHVAQRARGFIITAPHFHADGFRRRNLHMIDVAPVPNWLENAVTEAEDDDVLDRFLAEVMVNTINLRFLQHFFDRGIQGFGRIQIAPEGFFDDDALPMAV